MKKLLFLSFIMLIGASLFGQIKKKQFPVKKEKQIEVSKALKPLMKKAINSTEFKDESAFLTTEGVKLNRSSKEVQRNENGEYEVIFDIVDQNNSYDYKKMIYVETKEGSFTYYDEPNKNYKNPEANARLGWGCRWTGWSWVNSTFCYRNWWCRKKWNREATYQYQVKSKKCSNGIIKKVKYRLVKRRCGC